MEPLQFKEIRQLLSACRLIELSDKPFKSEKSQWDLYKGSYKVHTFTVPFELLYFYSDVRRDQIAKVKTSVFKPGETIVVYAPSSNVSSLKEIFEREAKGFWSTPEYLASFMIEELGVYRKRLADLLPSCYVRPHLEVPRGTVHSNPNPVELFLTDPSPNSKDDIPGSLAVVLAEAGHGKTYMCEWLVATLAQKNKSILPIYVSSTQWKNLHSEDLLSLETMLVSSFRALGTPIPWVEGKEDLFLKVALKAGLFRIVFDGFDEYALRNPGEISAQGTLETLSRLAADTGTRIVVTSRTSFWQAEFGEQDNDKNDAKAYLYNLQPFDRSQARNYFELKLGGSSDKTNKAIEIFAELSRDDAAFAGRGFVLLLIADLVESGTIGYSSSQSEKPLIRLMRALCERETLRHNLPINAEQQLLGLQNFVFDLSQGEPPSADTFGLAMQMVDTQLNSDAVSRLLDKMAPHALVERKAGEWFVRQEQVQAALLAMKLVSLSGDGVGGKSLLATFSRKAVFDAGSESDLGAMLTNFCLWKEKHGGGVSEAKRLIQSFFAASVAPLNELADQSLRRLATHIALRVLDASDSKTHVERVKFLESMFPNGAFDGVVFLGALSKFDWRGASFKNCVLENVRWTNCRFDATTVFTDCYLLGGSTSFCDGFSNVQWNNLQADEPGRLFIDSEAVFAGKRRYTEEDLKRDVICVLEKFIGKGGVGFKSVDEVNLPKGKIAISLHKDKVIDAIRRNLLDQHHISGGTQKALSLAEDSREAVRVLLSNNVITGNLSEVFEELRRRTEIVRY